MLLLKISYQLKIKYFNNLYISINFTLCELNLKFIF